MKGDERLPKAMGLGITARLLHVFSLEEIEKILRDHVDEREESTFCEHVFEVVRSASVRFENSRLLIGLEKAVVQVGEHIKSSQEEQNT